MGAADREQSSPDVVSELYKYPSNSPLYVYIRTSRPSPLIDTHSDSVCHCTCWLALRPQCACRITYTGQHVFTKDCFVGAELCKHIPWFAIGADELSKLIRILCFLEVEQRRPEQQRAQARDAEGHGEWHHTSGKGPCQELDP